MSFTDAPVPDDQDKTSDTSEHPPLAIADPTIVPTHPQEGDEQAATAQSDEPDRTGVDSTHQTPDAPEGDDRQTESAPPGSSPGAATLATPHPGNSPAPTRAVQKPIQPVHVDGRNRKNGDDGLEGHFVRVTDGEHKGRVGVFLQTLETEADGYPKRILVRTRDELSELLDVAYGEVKHTLYKGGR